MTKHRHSETAHALFTSIVALVLSMSMLVGTTMAWFTDNVESGVNQILAGNLDIELYNSIGVEKSKKVDSNTELFDNISYWEPGVVAYENLTVANEGSLALKYELAVNFTNATATPAGKTLEDALKVAFVDGGIEDGLSRAQVIEKAKTAGLGELASFNHPGEMQPGSNGTPTTHVYGIVIYWEPTANDNDFNMNSGSPTVLSIDLGIELIATQRDYESDSFGPDYDQGAVYADKTYVVDAGAVFADTLTNINAATEETVLVQLNQNIEWATGAGIGSTPWVDENAKVQDLIIDAQGKTITATGSGVGSIRMANGGTLTIKNATIKDESVSYAEGNWEYGYLEFAGNLIFENVDFVNAVMIEGDNATFKNCTFNSNHDNEYAVWVSDGNATFIGCSFTGARGLKTHEAYGSEVISILVDNCTFENLTKKPGMAIGTVNADTAITIKNSDFINCQPGDQGKFIYESDTDVTTFTFNCSENNEVIQVVTPDLEIATAEQLFAFANDVNVNGNSYAGKLVVLTADIDLNNAEWAPIGQTGGNGVATYFQGMFDGKGHTISNLKVTDNAYDEGKNYAAGFFGFVDAGDAQIVNLNISGANVNGHHWTGVIAGYLTGKITGCTVTNATVACTHANDDACGDKAGVIVGYVNSGIVTGNTVKDCTVTAGRDAGQVVGAAKTTQAYDNTIYNVTVTATGDCTGANIRNEEIGRVL